MTGSQIDAEHDDARAAAAIAEEAGQLLVALRQASCGTGEAGGADDHAPDQRSDELIARRLAERFPGDAVLSEEATDSDERLVARRVWIVDPLDGSREYGEPHRHDWAVHVALVEDGVLSAAAVALPAQGLVFSSSAPCPRPFNQDGPLRAGPVRVAVSRTRPPLEAAALADALGCELVPMGSAGAKTMAVVTGEVDAYVHAGGQYEWDAAAPVGVAVANGLHASRIDGSPFSWNQPKPWMPDLVICRPELADTILSAIADR
ncbi:MAG TPA: 3'(2'),5'-bisphosphate nucleotidase CysQ [Acidimicrobiales bacterium]|nr:3'(2'),5'-bisphosphate nucleotidase CysQ [Acidimicrobiales bacterium]